MDAFQWTNGGKHPKRQGTWAYTKSGDGDTFVEQWIENDPGQSESTRKIVPVYRYYYQFTIKGKKKPLKGYQSRFLRDLRVFNDPLKALIVRD